MARRTGLALKRIMDVAGAVVALTILAVPMALIAVAVVLDSGWPVFFIQERSGRKGRPFRICKFRTMVNNAQTQGSGVFTEDDDPRITRVGRWLRRWSLDELPQLFNVLKGEMSLVGPRPTLPYQVERYTSRQMGRLEMRPGITGWAQVNGRNSLTWPQRIELDLWYIGHWSLGLDFEILVRTVGVALRKEDVYGAPVDEISATSPEEMGERRHV